MNFELFNPEDRPSHSELIAPQASILRGFALPLATLLFNDLGLILQSAPLRQMITPLGFTMSVSMTNCGSFGWISDKNGYRYDSIDPVSKRNWPKMPPSFLICAINAAEEAGFQNFKPDSCLINQYLPKSKLSLHQDKDEKSLNAPIVSVSLGVPAIFLFGGFHRSDKTQRYFLEHGDVVVWGGASRLRFHGILPLKEAWHPLLGKSRINLTFRQAN